MRRVFARDGSKTGILLTTRGWAGIIAVSLTISASAQMFWPGALVVKQGVSLNGDGIYLDSYNSSDPAKSTFGRYDAAKYSGNGGDITVDGDNTSTINLGNATIFGTLHLGSASPVTLGASGSIGPHGSQATSVSAAQQAGYIVQDSSSSLLWAPSLPNTAAFLTPIGGTVYTWSNNIISWNTNSTMPPSTPPWGGVQTNIAYTTNFATYPNSVSPELITQIYSNTSSTYPNPAPAGLVTNINNVSGSSTLPTSPRPYNVTTNFITVPTTASTYPSPGTYLGTVSTNYPSGSSNETTYTYNQIAGRTYNYTTYSYTFPVACAYLRPTYSYTYNLYQTNTGYFTNTYDYILEACQNYVANNLDGKVCVKGSSATLVLPNGLTGQETFVFNQGASLRVYAGGASATLTASQVQGGCSARLTVFCSPSVTACTLTLDGPLTSVFVAPSANVSVLGGNAAEFSGCLVANSVQALGPIRFHYDEALRPYPRAGLTLPPYFGWAQGGSNVLTGGAYGSSRADALAADALGKVLVAGSFSGSSLVLGDTVLDGALGNNFLCKYDTSGSLQWVRLAGFRPAGSAPRLRVGTDAARNVYFAGHFAGTADLGGLQLTNAGTADLFLAKFSPQGQPLWARRIGAYDPQDYSPTFGFATDTAGNVFLGGSYAGVADFGSLTLTNTGGFLARYDAAGNLLWACGAPVAQTLAVSPSGALYLGTSANGGTLAKYDGAGHWLWSKPFPRATALAVDQQENLYATGNGAGTYDGLTLTNNGGLPDFFVCRCDAAGTVQWLRQVGSTTEQLGLALALDRCGGVFVSSSSAEARPDPVLSFGSFSLTNVSAFVAEYDSAGNALWAAPLVTPQRAAIWGLAALAPGVVGAAGDYRGSLTTSYATQGYFGFSEAPNSLGSCFVTKLNGLTPPQVSAPSQPNGAPLQLTVDGSAGFPCVVEGSSNLRDWVPLATNSLPFTFTDSTAASFPYRYYRAAYRP